MTTFGKAAELELKLAAYNEKIQTDNKTAPRETKSYEDLVGVIVDLHQEYRKQKDFDREMRLYNDQQQLFSQHEDKREFVPWEMYKGGCCNFYDKKDDALRYLENAFHLSQAGMKKYVSLLPFAAI